MTKVYGVGAVDEDGKPAVLWLAESRSVVIATGTTAREAAEKAYQRLMRGVEIATRHGFSRAYIERWRADALAMQTAHWTATLCASQAATPTDC